MASSFCHASVIEATDNSKPEFITPNKEITCRIVFDENRVVLGIQAIGDPACVGEIVQIGSVLV